MTKTAIQIKIESLEKQAKKYYKKYDQTRVGKYYQLSDECWTAISSLRKAEATLKLMESTLEDAKIDEGHRKEWKKNNPNKNW